MTMPVAVDDVVVVREVEAVADIGQHLQQLGVGEGLVAQQLFEVVPLHQLHGDVEDALVLAEFIDGHEVGMVQDSRGPGFPLEAGLGLIASGRGGEDGFDGHFAADGGVHAEVDLAHGAMS
jgi:hypothetical protein